jgi:uncharacterized protein
VKTHPSSQSNKSMGVDLTISLPARSGSLVVFFLLAFGISWVVWIPTALASYGLISVQIPPGISGLLGAFGPLIATLVATAIYDGKAGFSILFKRMLIWRVGIQWYLFVLFLPVILSLAKTRIAVVMGSAVPDFSQPLFVQLYPLPPELLNSYPFIMFLPFVFLQQMLFGSSMGEEPGWRGYALPRMQTHRNSLRASLLLGLLWSVWHFPLWLTEGHPLSETFLGWSVLGLMAMAVLFTWVYNNTKGSLLLALLFHTSIATTDLFLSTAEAHPLLGIAISWGIAILVIAISGTHDLSREATSA